MATANFACTRMGFCNLGETRPCNKETLGNESTHQNNLQTSRMKQVHGTPRHIESFISILLSYVANESQIKHIHINSSPNQLFSHVSSSKEPISPKAHHLLGGTRSLPVTFTVIINHYSPAMDVSSTKLEDVVIDSEGVMQEFNLRCMR